jgi:hypothetical protein
MNTKEKPKSWAVLNDGSQRFKDTVMKCLNEKYGHDFEGINVWECYGINKKGDFDIRNVSQLDHFDTILTLDEFCEIFLSEKKEYSKCTCANGLEYSNCHKQCERVLDEQSPNIDAAEEKQTAVEWLVSRLNKEGFAPVVTQEEIEQAKAMERQQIQDEVVEYLKSASKEMGIPMKKISISYDEKLTIRVGNNFKNL